MKKKYKEQGGLPDRKEGLKITFPDWWFLARVSNTEPVLRLVVEAPDDKELDRRIKEVINIIHS